MSITLHNLKLFLNDLLKPNDYKDYGPNGLQVEGKPDVERVAFCVSATLESIHMAIEQKADAMIVHHGILWDFHGVRPLVGPFGQRIKLLIKNDISLFGYHLPLDGHRDIGNASCIAQALGMQGLTSFGNHAGMPTGIQGRLLVPVLPEELKLTLHKMLNHPVLLSTHDLNRPISTLGIITGGANGGWRDAAESGLDAYLTGEMSEHDWHEASEASIHMFAGGHYATETFGIKALMEKVKAQFSLTCSFIESKNPA